MTLLRSLIQGNFSVESLTDEQLSQAIGEAQTPLQFGLSPDTQRIREVSTALADAATARGFRVLLSVDGGRLKAQLVDTIMLDMIVELPGGRSKRLADCTGQDLDAAISLLDFDAKNAAKELRALRGLSRPDGGAA